MLLLRAALALSLSLAATATFASGSGQEKPSHGEAKHRATLYDGLLSGGDQGELSTFVDLMTQLFTQEGLQRLFDGEESFTVFAPTNAAFEEFYAALSDEQLADLEDLDTGILKRLLYFHITKGAWARPTGALKMLDDNVAQTYREGRDFKIEEAKVLDQDHYRNGTVATIDTVMSDAVLALVKIYFLNCQQGKVFFDVYGGGDIFCIIPSDIAGVDANGGTNSVYCSNNKQGCQVRFASESTVGACHPMRYANEGQTVVAMPFQGRPSIQPGQVTQCPSPGATPDLSLPD